MKDLIFAFLLGSGETEREAMVLARSIRTFGGEFCFSPIWMLSQKRESELSETIRQEIFSSGLRLLTFDMSGKQATFPFSSYVTAAGIAETLAQGETSYLAMLALDTIVLQPPTEFLLQAGKSLGACPVHLKLLGNGFADPLDEFWKLIYHHCNVDPERVFPVQTIVDEQQVRAYFNAGLLVVRPERGILRRWQSAFESIYDLPDFAAFYQLHELYQIFMHQAVLAGSILSTLKPEEIQQFPFEINYPLHLHTKIAAARRPANLSQLITLRYEDFSEIFGNSKINSLVQIDSPMQGWLQDQLK